MGKKPALSLRKPPAPVDLVSAERFVQSGDVATSVQALERSDARGPSRLGASTPGRPDVQTSASREALAVRPVEVLASPVMASRGVLARKDGRELRRMTLYLPNDLARRLAVHCATHDLEMSEVVTAAVRHHLEE